jgi:hypothetical protein
MQYSISEKGSEMRIQPNSIRTTVTRVLAAGVLLVMYALGMIATTGAFMTAGVSSAYAQRGRGRGGGRGGGWDGGGGAGAAIGLGIGAAIIGGAIAAHEAERAAAQENAVGYCMRRFRSNDPESGTYVGKDGLRRPCP